MALSDQLLHPNMEGTSVPDPIARINGERLEEGRRWWILLAFCANSAANAFMFMDFTTVPTVTKQVFGFCPAHNVVACEGVGDEFVGWTYSASLLAVVPAVILVMALIERHAWAVFTSTLGSQCTGAWMRYVAVCIASSGDTELGKDLAILSAILIGFGSAGCVVAYSAIANQWFALSERALATSCIVQSNYAGWALGALMFPYSVFSGHDLIDLQFLQAVGVSIAFGVYLVVYREKEEEGNTTGLPASQAATPRRAKHPGFVEGMHILATSPQYVLQCLCYSCMAGVSFAVPAFQTTAFHAIGLSEKESAWTNLAFIGTGVVVGLLAGKYCTRPKSYSAVIKTMFVAASAGMAAACVTTLIQDRLSASVLYVLLVIQMMVCGASTLGFIGIALSAVVETTHPVSSELSGGTVELFVQIFGAMFSEGGVLLGEHAFVFCGVATWIVTVLLLTCYKQEFRRTGAEAGTAHRGDYTALACGTAIDSSAGLEPEQQCESEGRHEEYSSRVALLGAGPSVSVQR